MSRATELPKTMLALVKAGPGLRGVSLRSWLVPRPRTGEVLVRVRAVGVCGTDLHIIHDEYDHAEPLVLGHEWAGEVVALGSKVRGWRVGARVVGELHTRACGRCPLCRSGNQQICPFKRPYGTYEHGALATYFRIPVPLLHRIPPGFSYAEAALLEPTACAIHGSQRVPTLRRSDTVAVVGHGPIGLLLATYLQNSRRVRRVVLVGSSRHGRSRLTITQRLGIRNVVDSQRGLAAVQRAVGRAGADVVFEAGGSADSIPLAVDLAKRDGTIGLLGLSSRPVSLPWNDLVKRDLTLVFSFSSNAAAWEEAIRAFRRGWIRPRALGARVLPLRQWRRGLALLAARRTAKVILVP